MSSKPTASGRPNDDGQTPLQHGIEHALRALNAGVKLGRKHGPVVARKTAAGLKQVGTAIRDNEHTKKIARTGRKAGKAAGRAVKKKVEKHPWLSRTLERISETTTRVTDATREHLDEKRYFEKSLKALEEQVKRHPAVENAWKRKRHAFSMGPESSVDKPAAPTARKKAAVKKRTARKKAATRKKTTAKKTATKKKTPKKKDNRVA